MKRGQMAPRKLRDILNHLKQGRTTPHGTQLTLLCEALHYSTRINHLTPKEAVDVCCYLDRAQKDSLLTEHSVPHLLKIAGSLLSWTIKILYNCTYPLEDVEPLWKEYHRMFIMVYQLSGDTEMLTNATAEIWKDLLNVVVDHRILPKGRKSAMMLLHGLIIILKPYAAVHINKHLSNKLCEVAACLPQLGDFEFQETALRFLVYAVPECERQNEIPECLKRWFPNAMDLCKIFPQESICLGHDCRIFLNHLNGLKDYARRTVHSLAICLARVGTYDLERPHDDANIPWYMDINLEMRTLTIACRNLAADAAMTPSQNLAAESGGEGRGLTPGFIMGADRVKKLWMCGKLSSDNPHLYISVEVKCNVAHLLDHTLLPFLGSCPQGNSLTIHLDLLSIGISTAYEHLQKALASFVGNYENSVSVNAMPVSDQYSQESVSVSEMDRCSQDGYTTASEYSSHGATSLGNLFPPSDPYWKKKLPVHRPMPYFLPHHNPVGFHPYHRPSVPSSQCASEELLVHPKQPKASLDPSTFRMPYVMPLSQETMDQALPNVAGPRPLQHPETHYSDISDAEEEIEEGSSKRKRARQEGMKMDLNKRRKTEQSVEDHNSVDVVSTDQVIRNVHKDHAYVASEENRNAGRRVTSSASERSVRGRDPTAMLFQDVANGTPDMRSTSPIVAECCSPRVSPKSSLDNKVSSNSNASPTAHASQNTSQNLASGTEKNETSTEKSSSPTYPVPGQKWGGWEPVSAPSKKKLLTMAEAVGKSYTFSDDLNVNEDKENASVQKPRASKPRRKRYLKPKRGNRKLTVTKTHPKKKNLTPEIMASDLQTTQSQGDLEEEMQELDPVVEKRRGRPRKLTTLCEKATDDNAQQQQADRAKSDSPVEEAANTAAAANEGIAEQFHWGVKQSDNADKLIFHKQPKPGPVVKESEADQAKSRTAGQTKKKPSQELLHSPTQQKEQDSPVSITSLPLPSQDEGKGTTSPSAQGLEASQLSQAEPLQCEKRTSDEKVDSFTSATDRQHQGTQKQGCNTVEQIERPRKRRLRSRRILEPSKEDDGIELIDLTDESTPLLPASAATDPIPMLPAFVATDPIPMLPASAATDPIPMLPASAAVDLIPMQQHTDASTSQGARTQSSPEVIIPSSIQTDTRDGKKGQQFEAEMEQHTSPVVVTLTSLPTVTSGPEKAFSYSSLGTNENISSAVEGIISSLSNSNEEDISSSERLPQSQLGASTATITSPPEDTSALEDSAHQEWYFKLSLSQKKAMLEKALDCHSELVYRHMNQLTENLVEKFIRNMPRPQSLIPVKIYPSTLDVIEEKLNTELQNKLPDTRKSIEEAKGKLNDTLGIWQRLTEVREAQMQGRRSEYEIRGRLEQEARASQKEAFQSLLKENQRMIVNMWQRDQRNATPDDVIEGLLKHIQHMH